MSRKAPREFLAAVMGEVYTLHFVPSFKHAKHYTGWAAEGRVPRRVVSHALGRGANLTKQQIEAGGTWVVADVEPGTHDRETQLKERGASRRCRVCKAERAIEAGRITPEQAMEQWVSASEYERGLLRQLFGLEPEAKPDLPPAKAFRPRPAPKPATPEQLAEMDALVDELCKQWRAELEEQPPSPKAQADSEHDWEMEAG